MNDGYLTFISGINNKNMSQTKVLGKRKRIALVAHDHKKSDLLEWAKHNSVQLAKHELFATGTTGRLLEETLDRPVKKLLSGPLGGDQQIGAMIANGEISEEDVIAGLQELQAGGGAEAVPAEAAPAAAAAPAEEPAAV